jgi:hypothetical protein
MPQFRISEHYYEKRYKSPDPTKKKAPFPEERLQVSIYNFAD